MESGSEFLFRKHNCCVLIPTYNNASTLKKVVDGVLNYTDRIIIINDGSTDATSEVLQAFTGIHIVTFPQNRGKGMALRQGFKEAAKAGYDYAITIDSDGQHLAEDIPVFLQKLDEQPGSLIVGARDMTGENIPGKSSFGHRFSNFWFRLETGINLPDTQCGFRLYPVKELGKRRFFTSRYEFEIEVLVRAAWIPVPVVSVPVHVRYEKGRVTHFRPIRDFARVSLLNTWLVILTILWHFPKRFFYRIKKKTSGDSSEKRYSILLNRLP